ncbi:DUF1750-domain-containing protein [Periconia macrospinosa]|uniref:DUF1750-domain-containing protein n=1 Tax=Periconia macrospinosa TaxID=97972 RepID=A0A2V1DSC8_9PLEO|nr:DUF1750-domain-containing protein [Periconia macrospinosa]
MYGANQAYNMADPSAQVPTQLLPHVHLISQYRFPTVASLQPPHALDYLLKGPSIVKDAAAVAWTYLPQPPGDGTVLLTWQAPRLQTLFASDGLVWGDPEVAFDMNIRGYQVQIFVHKCGFHYPHEQVASHARYRYRIANGPSGTFDPNLWIVHYTMAEQNMRIPATQIPISREVHAQLAMRAQLQSAGQLVRKEFMLYDSANWPKVEFTQPTARGQQAYYNPMQRPQPYQNGVGPPPAKRARGANQPPVRPVGPAAIVPDTALEDEENSTQDIFDFMTPREISLSRYKQHHEWMEEIFASPHTIGKIMPIDLGFGLMGELAPLTANILDAPAGDAPIDALGEPNLDYKNKVKAYEKLRPEQLKEFETRVSTYISKEEAEIEKMKAAHAKKMAALKKSRTYIKAERRLRDANHPHDSDKDGADPLDAVVKDLEKSAGIEFATKKVVVCVDKGGFMEVQQPPPQKTQTNGSGTTPSNSNNDSNEGGLEGDNTAASLLDQFGSGSLTGTPGGNLSVPALSQPQSQTQSAVATPAAPAAETAQTSSFDEQAANLETTDNAENGLLDLDVEMSGMANTSGKSGESDWVMVDEQNNGTAQQTTQPPASTATPADASVLPTTSVDAEAGDMFSGEFSNFENLDSAGDALADFPADDTMGLDLVDDSAFGDAFQGMGENA